jgi:P4 family phage/plasmid primase-like protien
MTDLLNEEGRAPVGNAAVQAVSEGLDQKPRDDHAAARAHLAPLFDAGMDLIPLNPPDALDRKGEPVGKAPLRPGWRTADPLDLDAAVDHMVGGCNVGVRLRATDLVVDADPRNYLGDDDALARLVADFGLSTHPRVVTGGGGSHIYLTKPADVLTVEKLNEYHGVEFKTLGRQVVAPGSVHPETRKTYRLELDPLDDAVTAEAPTALVLALTRPEVVGTSEVGSVTPEQLDDMLYTLDPSDYRDQDRWLTLMMSCHHATGGAGREEFVAWSTSDPQYADDAWIVGRRWDSLHADDKGRRVTERTLYKWVIAAGGEASIPRASAEEDFAGIEDAEVPEGGLDAMPPLPTRLVSVTPMAVAKAMLDGHAVVRSNGDWLRYDTGLNSYVEEEQEAFSSRVWTWADGRPYRKGNEDKRLVADSALVSNVTAAASAQRQGPRVLPAWHPHRAMDPDPADLLAVRNGLLNLASGELLPPDPRFINRNASPVVYDPDAPPPRRWLAFLEEVFPDDAEVRDTLQEVVGYLLTQDTSQQKVFCMVGPTRSGKGTVSRVVQSLLGEGNYTSPTAGNLSRGEFGLQGLIGKTLATISDMRMGRNSDPATLSENLLRISGEDEVSVNRKFKEPWEGRLSTRFLILSNEVPQFRDTSGAIVARLILLRGHVSFLGREDPGLQRKLRQELPGILNWALEGLARLRRRGHFVQPASSAAELKEAVGLASPVKAFARKRLRQAPGVVTAKAEVWWAFTEWVEDEGLTYTGTMGHFFKDLRTVGLTFDNCRPRVDGERVHSVAGVELLADE